MLKAYRYKLEPNQSQRYALARALDVCRELYNDCLYQRKLQPISRYEQSKQLTQLKAEFPVYKNVYSQVLQNVLDRLDKAFNSFFRSGFGFPRFKGANRFDSFTYPQAGFSLGGRRLSLAKIGNVKLRLSRPLPRGAVVKTCTIKRSVNGWFATLTFEHQPVPLPANDLAVGIDVGVTTFAKFTDGTEIPNPRIYRNSQAKLRRAQRRVARRKKGSHRRGRQSCCSKRFTRASAIAGVISCTSIPPQSSESMERLRWKGSMFQECLVATSKTDFRLQLVRMVSATPIQ